VVAHREAADQAQADALGATRVDDAVRFDEHALSGKSVRFAIRHDS
jgi:hypothetical protein